MILVSHIASENEKKSSVSPSGCYWSFSTNIALFEIEILFFSPFSSAIILDFKYFKSVVCITVK